MNPLHDTNPTRFVAFYEDGSVQRDLSYIEARAVQFKGADRRGIHRTSHCLQHHRVGRITQLPNFEYKYAWLGVDLSPSSTRHTLGSHRKKTRQPTTSENGPPDEPTRVHRIGEPQRLKREDNDRQRSRHKSMGRSPKGTQGTADDSRPSQP